MIDLERDLRFVAVHYGPQITRAVPQDLDREYLRRWAVRLEFADLLDRALMQADHEDV